MSVHNGHLSAQADVLFIYEILDVALLRLRFQKCFGLGLNQNLPL